jgi:photosystem II stability/assembly factor-like uncharacterized protein
MKKLLTTMVFILFFLDISFAQDAWTLQSTLTGLGSSPAISVYSPTGVVVAGGISSQPKVFKSTDSGVSWTDITGNLAGNPKVYSVWAVDENLIFAGDGGSNSGNGGNAKIWKTTNGGTSWTTILTTGGSNGYINGIVFSRTMPNFGVIQSDPPTGDGQPYWIAKTTDGGNNWIVTNAPGVAGSSAILRTVMVIDNLFYGFGTYPAGNVYFTTDGGATWNFPNSGVGKYSIPTGFAFSSDKTYGITVEASSLPNIKRTTNGGVNWSWINTGGDVTGYFSRMIWVYGTSTCYLTGEVGSGGTIKKSVDNGATWVTQSTAGTTMLYSIDLVYVSGTVYAYAIAVNGRVIKLYDILTGVESTDNTVPADYSLSQNFPNPFNPTTKIKYSVPETGHAPSLQHVILKIYDILGRDVATLVNEEKSAGSYTVELNAAKLSSGVYFYKLIAGEFIQTKKMLLIK